MATRTQRSRAYLLCRPIFSGDSAQLRKRKKVRELVRANAPALRSLLGDIGEERLVAVLRDLLEDRIFESELRAKVQFPELFRSSAQRDSQRHESEADAVRSSAEVLDEIGSRDGGEGEEEVGFYEPVTPDEPADAPPPDSPPPPSPPNQLPSLYPSYLPYRTQHLILNTAQQVLEDCCFDFATASMPSVLLASEWDCPRAVELTHWLKVFRTRRQPRALLEPGGADTLARVARLRHTAVHRLPLTARGIGQLLEAAVGLAKALGDVVRAARLEELQSDLESKVKAMELNKNVLEDTAARELEAIQRRREELEAMEAKLIQEVLREDLDNKALIGQLLEKSTRAIFDPEKQGVDKKGKGYEEEREESEEEGDGDGQGVNGGLDVHEPEADNESWVTRKEG